MTAVNPTAAPKPLDQVRGKMHTKHHTYSTERTCVLWIRHFIFFNNQRHPAEMGAPEIEAFLAHLAVRGKAASASGNS